MAIFANRRKSDTELGFGTKNYSGRVRFINADGQINVKRSGLGGIENIDIYHWLISTSLIKLFSVIFAGYITVNTLFALIYFWIGADYFGGIAEGTPMSDFLALFFFSAQTLTTVGYGHIYPASTTISTIAAIESLLGLLGFALATGVLYGRFSRPKAHLLYSRNAIIAPYMDITGLMFRVANYKQYELIETDAQVIISMDNKVTNRRDFLRLQLERDKINFLTLSWTIVHPIDDKSPVYGLSVQDLIERDAEIIILIKGINDTQSQSVFSRYSYKADEMLENVKFKPLTQFADPKGRLNIDVKEIHSVLPVQPVKIS